MGSYLSLIHIAWKTGNSWRDISYTIHNVHKFTLREKSFFFLRRKFHPGFFCKELENMRTIIFLSFLLVLTKQHQTTNNLSFPFYKTHPESKQWKSTTYFLSSLSFPFVSLAILYIGRFINGLLSNQREPFCKCMNCLNNMCTISIISKTY